MTSIAPSTTLSPQLQETLKALNIRHNEYAKIVQYLEREPNFTELVMFSNLWSEHCSYKHTKHLLKTLPVEGPQIAQGPGENAGIVDCGDGLLVAFKVESHNHPTYVEPFQGAATGVGGILRDIITMNARPVANLNALRFGPIQAEADPSRATSPEQAKANTYRFGQAIAGIAHYGNCMGIPTIAGDVVFDPCYSGNPLVNAMAIGIMEPSGVMKAGARGKGYPVLYVGSPTGKDGMGGASFASRSIESEIASQDRPAVQVGDPFAEKLLLESCLEVFKSGAIVAAQDMGAAGLTCATAEMAAKGEVGMRIDLDKVPAREPNMLAWEYLASESQERMLMVVEPERLAEVQAIFDKWEVPSAVIGTVEDGDRLHIYHHGKQVVDLPVPLLTDMTPQYAPAGRPEEPESFRLRRERDAASGLPELSLASVENALTLLLAHPNVASRQAVYQQYDRHVRNSTVLDSANNSGGVIQLRLPDGSFSGKGLAASLDGNPFHVALNPYTGSMGAIAESARNVAAVGARPLATTDNLNFGDPEDPEVYYQLYWSVKGIKDACEALQTPVTGGNVSLYNLNESGAILPSPTIGMVGLLNDASRALSPHWKQAGDRIALLGVFRPSLGGSQYQQLKAQGAIYGNPPQVYLKDELLLARLLETLAEKGLLQSAQDVSVGGLLTTLIECSFAERSVATQAPLLGQRLNLTALVAETKSPRLDTLLFGETHGSYLISYRAENEAAIQEQLLGALGPTPIGLQSKLLPLGEVTGEATLQLELEQGSVALALEPLWQAWAKGLSF